MHVILHVMGFHHATLDNGLEILVEENETSCSAAIGFFVKTGSRDESGELSGVSHFLEHLVFKGSEKHRADDVNRRLDEMGAETNAYTSEELTAFYGSVLPELSEPLLELFADILRPALRESDLETEKQVVLEEIGMYEDQPPFGADETLKRLFYPDHPLGNGILGSVESLCAMRPKHVREYFERRYVPGNILLVACGKIDFAGFLRGAERHCGHWSCGKNRGETALRTLRGVRGRRGVHTIPKDRATMRYTMQMVDAPGGRDCSRWSLAAELMCCVLGDATGSRLYWQLVDPGYVESAGLGFYEFLDNGYFLTGVSGVPERHEANLARLAKVYRDVHEFGLTAEELDRAKNKTLARIVFGNESPQDRLFSLADEWIARNRHLTVQEEIAELRSVSLEEIHRILERFPLVDPFSLTIGPGYGI